MSTPRIVLAYSGGLDTSWCVLRLAGEGRVVHTVHVDTGGVTDEERERVRVACLRVIGSYGADGAYLEVNAAPLPELSLGVGTLLERPAPDAAPGAFLEHTMFGAHGAVLLGRAWLAGPVGSVEMAADALEHALRTKRVKVMGDEALLLAIADAVRGGRA